MQWCYLMQSSPCCPREAKLYKSLWFHSHAGWAVNLRSRVIVTQRLWLLWQQHNGSLMRRALKRSLTWQRILLALCSAKMSGPSILIPSFIVQIHAAYCLFIVYILSNYLLFCVEHRRRMSCEDALAHGWMAYVCVDNTNSTTKNLSKDKMKKFLTRQKWKVV